MREYTLYENKELEQRRVATTIDRNILNFDDQPILSEPIYDTDGTLNDN